MVTKLMWRLASPYDAYVSHVARLEEALARIRFLSERPLAYEAALRSSVRMTVGEPDAAERESAFRERLAAAAEDMSDEAFEAFLRELGGGKAANVEHDRARTSQRLDHVTASIEDYFAGAGQALAKLEERGYNPNRRDIARQLKENGLAARTVDEYRRLLHDAGRAVARTGARAS